MAARLGWVMVAPSIFVSVASKGLIATVRLSESYESVGAMVRSVPPAIRWQSNLATGDFGQTAKTVH